MGFYESIIMKTLTESIIKNIITEINGYDILYIGLLLDNKSKDRLLKITESVVGNCAIKDAQIFCHHMTIAFKNNISQGLLEWAEGHEGEEYDIIVNKIGLSNKACAVSVKTECPSLNQIKHITLFTHNGGKPVDSNYIEDWDFITPFKLRGYVKIVRKF